MEGATTGMESVSSALVTSLTSVGTELTGLIGDILPIALPIIGAVVVITFGIKIFKKVTAKA